VQAWRGPDTVSAVPGVLKNYFDGEIAENYDRDSALMFDPGVVGVAVDFLAELAGDGAALELGIGT
jgi:hypothetical protein